MIIDCRIRPPFGQFLNMVYPYDFKLVDPLAKSLGLKAAESGRNHSVEEMIDEMKAAGVVKAVIMGRQSPLWGSIPNDEIAELINRYPDLFLGVGGVHPLPFDEALKEIERCVKDLGFVAMAVEPGAASPPMYPDDPAIYPVYLRCQQLGVPLFMTVSGLVGPNIGYAMPSHIDKVAVDFPDLKIIVSHAAFPWVTPMLGSALYRPNIYLLPDIYLPNMPGGEEYVRAANVYLEERLIFGSAYPIASFESILDGYRKMPFKKEVLEKVLYGNAARLFNIT
ncbi:MAG: amidohydrolase family protein [Pseudomonadota bacterium]